MNCSEKIARCKTHVLLAYPWWATLLLQLRVVETDQVPTMAVDGTHLFINGAFALGLSDGECEAVLMHETAHCALLHCYRRKWREPFLWNLACDAAVNALLAADELRLPEGCVPPAPLEKTAEMIYDEMLQSAPRIKIPQDVLSPGEGPQSDGPMTESKWRDVLSAARGLEPSGLSRAIKQGSEPARDWREDLARFVSSTCKADFHTWTRPSRRVSGMPGWKRTPQNTIALCIDTSGSIDSDTLGAFARECEAICALNGISAYIIGADAAVHDLLEPGSPFPVALCGGGGTSFVPALAKAEALMVDAALYFTDGDGTFPGQCEVPVMWALTRRVAVPFGEAVYLRD